MAGCRGIRLYALTSILIRHKGRKMNSLLTYMYRDAGNWKQHKTIILRGIISEDDKEFIRSSLEDQLYFLPEQVGLEALQKRWDSLNDLDHIWHELDVDEIELTEMPPTIKLSAARLIRNFSQLRYWDVSRANRRLFGESYMA
jgi:hypothetical protein